jgi:arylformamidase
MRLDEFDILDISPTIATTSPVFPGDVPFTRTISLDFSKGHHLLLSSINMTLHMGSHADAPSHYHEHGQSIDQRDLRHYLGRAQVIDVSDLKGSLVTLGRIVGEEIHSPRVLFKTRSFPHPGPWIDHFSALSPDLIDYLAKAGVITIGIDTPSIDPADSKTLSAHQAIYDNDLAILEGLNLDAVEPGVYHLIALPLKIAGGDASPVRAVLIRNFS